MRRFRASARGEIGIHVRFLRSVDRDREQRVEERRESMDFELLEMPDGFDADFVGVVLMVAADGGLEQEQFFLDHAARVACTNLYVQRKQDAGDVIAGVALRIAQPGTYRFDFKREAKRLNGVWDTEAEQYLDNYRSHVREQAGGNSS